jgi:serine/threonine-protein kinase RsbW
MVDIENVPADNLQHGERAIGRSVRNAWPPARTAQLGRWTLETFGELRLLRAALCQALIEQRMPDGTVRETLTERIMIVANELAANAMKYAKPPATVALFRTETTFIVDVSDNDPWVAPQFAEERHPGAGGLGLRMTSKLSLDMGWYLDGGTKCVWAQVAIPMAGRDAGDEFSAVDPGTVHLADALAQGVPASV